MSASVKVRDDGLYDGQLRWVLVVLCVGAIASILDSTIVNIAIDHLSRVFGASIQTTQWLMTGFLLAMAAVSPLSGWLLDRFGGRISWMVSLGIFLAGSILCGCATSLSALIACRVLQGLGAGLILPILMAVMTQAAGQERLMHAMGVFTVLVQVGPMIGPVVGSILVQYANWRWLFLANIPFCLFGLLGVGILPDRWNEQRKPRLDGIGLVLLSTAMVGVLYGFGALDPAHPRLAADWLGPLVAGLILLVVFVGWSFRMRASALIDVRLFGDSDFSLASILAILSGFVSFGGLLLLPLYFQQVLGITIIRSGLYLVPQGLGTAMVVLAGKKILAAWPRRRRVLLGFLLMAAGTVPYGIAELRATTWLLLVALVIRGVGIGLSVPVINQIALATLPGAEVSRGTTAFNIVQRLGAPFGTTVLSIVLVHALTGAQPTPHGLAHAYATPFWLVLGLTLLPILVAVTLPREVNSPASSLAPEQSWTDPDPRDDAPRA